MLTAEVNKEKIPIEVSTDVLERSKGLLLAHQFPEGYWWYTLEANESINAERILLNRYLGIEDPELESGLVRRIVSSQREDGSWPLYYGGPGDLSTTIECYWVVKMALELPLPTSSFDKFGTGSYKGEEALQRAHRFILSHGGLSKCRVFTRIHLALFGLVSWDICPVMPAWMILLPTWFPVNVYEFSSWARASIIPLLVIQSRKKIRNLPADFLNELYVEDDPKTVDWSFPVPRFFSPANFFVVLDRLLRVMEKAGVRILEKKSLKVCEGWIRDHISRTEDIYPALAYGAMALHALGYPVSDPTIQKCLRTLKKFEIPLNGALPALPTATRPPVGEQEPGMAIGEAYVVKRMSLEKTLHASRFTLHGEPVTGQWSLVRIYQQCCISPVWDSPWAGVALLEAGMPPESPEILKCARWLISKQIRGAQGDWAIKNKKGIPGGWSFEFENDFFPDVDDTIQVVDFLQNSALPDVEKSGAIDSGIAWILSMQSKNGGWAAFDVNNTKEFLNHIPFADHGACLDPPTPDITARAVGLFATAFRLLSSPHRGTHDSGDPVHGNDDYFPGPDRCTQSQRLDSRPRSPLAAGMTEAVRRGIHFLEKTQEVWGGWWGRWGVNYLYGTWCVLDGLARAGYPMNAARIRRAVAWLKSVQNSDGGFGESCESYPGKKFVPLSESVPSQTAWGLMALVAAGETYSPEATRATEWFKSNQRSDGSWDEPHHTGTGFPGHFYIRYHGYRHYFPLLALARYRRAKGPIVPS